MAAQTAEPGTRLLIPAFWDWWVEMAKDRFAAAVASGSWADLPVEMSARVQAIDPGLQWS